MKTKEDILQQLKMEMDRWEALLRGLSEEEIVAHELPNQWSIKDVMAHLMAWQQTTNARLEAARLNREPELPKFAEHEMEVEGPPNEANAWIYETYKDEPWSVIYRRWREGFQRVLDTGAVIPERDLLDQEKYPWLEGYSLYDVLQSSYEHHHEEHYGPLLEWFSEHRHSGAS